jgi:hypothetical protein
VKVTVTPGTGLLAASRTITDIGTANALEIVALWLFPAFTATDAATWVTAVVSVLLDSAVPAEAWAGSPPP